MAKENGMKINKHRIAMLIFWLSKCINIDVACAFKYASELLNFENISR